jgi:hypothetical protein
MAIPKYEDRTLLTEADYAYWEVLLDDGTVQRETDGTRYDAIDRGRLVSFRIVHHGEIQAEIRPDPTKGATGHNLVYRRRIRFKQGGRSQVFVMGFAPMGPVCVLDLNAGQMDVYDGFDPMRVDITPPFPLPGEPRQMLPLRRP